MNESASAAQSTTHEGPGTVVVGGGLAAAHCVHELRESGYTKPVMVIAAENEVPYGRPPLSKEFLQGGKPAKDLAPFPASWYADNDVVLRLGTTAESIDVVARRVSLSDSNSVGYEHLVLATGCRSRLGGRGADMVGWNLPGVFTLRSLDDARKIKDQLISGKSMVIVGAGWIGMEVGATARAAGLDVTVLTPDELPLARAMGSDFGSHIAQLHIANGVQCHFGARVTGIGAGPEGGLLVQTGTGDIPADTVLLAIGAAPNNELAVAAGLEVDGGVIVDEHLRSSAVGILAAGDIAEAYNTTLGRNMRVEHWDNAIRQGKLAAATILGRDESYDWLPYFFTDQFDLGMEYVGDRQDGDEAVVRGEMGSGEFIIFWLRQGIVTAAMNANIWDVNDHLRSMIGKIVPVATLQDTGNDLMLL